MAAPTKPKAPEHPAFSLLRSETIEEYGATCHVYEHIASKAQARRPRGGYVYTWRVLGRGRGTAAAQDAERP